MADILIDNQTAPSTPAAGKSVIFVDSTVKRLVTRDDTGRYTTSGLRNYSIANDPSAFATDLYVVGSNVLLPSFGVQAGTKYFLQMSASKTAAGVATPIYSVRIGSAGAIADTSRLALTGTAQTAVIDIGVLNILLVVRAVSASVGVIQGSAWWDHRGTVANTTTSGTGFASDTTGIVEGTSASFDNSALGGNYIGVSINGGASAAWTVTQVHATVDI